MTISVCRRQVVLFMGNSEYVLSNVSKIIIKKLDYEKEFI
jgi:hypothetical protein